MWIVKACKILRRFFLQQIFYLKILFDFRANLTKNRPNVLSIALHALQSNDTSQEKVKTTSLYPFDSVELVVFFIYGTDYPRQINSNLFSKLKLFLFNWTNLFVILVAFVLCFIRRLNNIRANGLPSVLIDVVVIFIGGGKLRMDQKLERWFFVIVSIGALFLNSICLGPTLFPSFLLPQRTIDTFQQLTELNPPIYLVPMLRPHEEIVREMLKLVYSNCCHTFFGALSD